MKNTVSVELPQSLAELLEIKEEEFASEVLNLSVVKLYEMGKISSGKAAELLEIPRIDFLDALASYGTSHFLNEGLEEDLNNA
ncbi:MAG: UPF0175 family protein [Cyclobacteriaceae bacterium]